MPGQEIISEGKATDRSKDCFAKKIVQTEASGILCYHRVSQALASVPAYPGTLASSCIPDKKTETSRNFSMN
jgi:hypothetical protein